MCISFGNNHQQHSTDKIDGVVDMVLMINSIVRIMRMWNMAMVNAQGACVCFQTLACI